VRGAGAGAAPDVITGAAGTGGFAPVVPKAAGGLALPAAPDAGAAAPFAPPALGITSPVGWNPSINKALRKLKRKNNRRLK